MNKNAIQKYAIWARNELIEQVKQRAYQYDISETGYGDEHATVVSGRVLSTDEKRQRHAFIEEIKQSGYKQTIEEVAYTWFNRFVALRYMEVNDYLPTHIRVFSDAGGNFNPEILTNVLHLDLPSLDKSKVSTLLNANATEELYRYLLLTQCNALNSILPEMFERMGAYTEMLLPNNILKPESVIGRLVNDIPEEDFLDAVQIIGWLYQYYNTEPKQVVFDDLKKNIKIIKENIPAATQLFTPDWIVRYMVENSLGRLWYEGHPDETLKSNWKYYLDEADQEEAVQTQLDQIREEYKTLKPEEIKCIDPCMGSGHILVYMFDVLMQIYESNGYNPRDAAVSIVENNLYGLDIDERAAQLAYFAVMMKARQYDRRFLSRGIKPHIYAIDESNGITTAPMHDMGLNLTENEYELAVKQAMRLVEEMHDAKEYGSLINITPSDWDLLRRFAVPRDVSGQMMIDIHGEQEASRRLQYLINIGEVLAQKYDVVVINPPYMGSKGMGAMLVEFLKANYKSAKNDLFAAFIYQCQRLAKTSGYIAMITMQSWMFKTAYKATREILLTDTIINMAHLGSKAFEEIGGEVVQTTAFVRMKQHIVGYLGKYVKLSDYENSLQKESNLFNKDKLHIACQDDFANVPGYIFAYWLSSTMIDILSSDKLLESIAAARKGLTTGDNDRFVRLWHEVNIASFSIFGSSKKWFPMTKGGDWRKWYGNNEYVVDWKNDGFDIKNFKDERGNLRSRPQNIQYYFREGLSWNDTGSGSIAFRFQKQGYIPNASGPCVYGEHNMLFSIAGLLNSCVTQSILEVLAPTLKFEVGQIQAIPIKAPNLNTSKNLSKECIDIAAADWDSFETSWDFTHHPLISGERKIAVEFAKWECEAAKRFDNLKANEEELNRIFIDIYGMQDELTPEVEDKDITLKTNTAYRYKQKKKKTNDDEFEMQEEIVEAAEIRNAKFLRDTISEFISYAVGCMFGRYSLDCEGLAFAGGEWNADSYKKFPADKDNIIPICDDEYFDDDIVGRFVTFVKTVYGEVTLEENLKFIADALGGNGMPREVIRNYFLKDFYKDHCKIYQNRPIYWLFDSGKKHGFKALIYMHRYTPDLLAKLRTDYVHEQQERYRTQLSHVVTALNTASGAERAKLLKQQDKLTEQLAEITIFEEKVHHLADQNISIDLDDGVKHNYKIFADVLAKI
ncbi:BREX-1 system adenine-specific DNA-methyltransferase PglX [Acetobacterium wieringae]|uniref:BREX-1 system adenine-specific DNA-methyltransferase PglX n=1 Tax=Acetobacterium wieringae TaxID=52694 RepID=UPI0026F0686C|nr:BREX-1 system adenine-specific DNA-methyltransferase PglX [Acetobacterium wieringae]